MRFFPMVVALALAVTPASAQRYARNYYAPQPFTPEWAAPQLIVIPEVGAPGTQVEIQIPGKRFHKTGANTIQWTVTFDDPIYFTRPWSITRTFTRGKPDDRLMPYTCNENNRDVEHLRPYQPNLNYKHTPDPRSDSKAPPKPPPSGEPQGNRN